VERGSKRDDVVVVSSNERVYHKSCRVAVDIEQHSNRLCEHCANLKKAFSERLRRARKLNDDDARAAAADAAEPVDDERGMPAGDGERVSDGEPAAADELDVGDDDDVKAGADADGDAQSPAIVPSTRRSQRGVAVLPELSPMTITAEMLGFGEFAADLLARIREQLAGDNLPDQSSRNLLLWMAHMLDRPRNARAQVDGTVLDTCIRIYDRVGSNKYNSLRSYLPSLSLPHINTLHRNNSAPTRVGSHVAEFVLFADEWIVRNVEQHQQRVARELAHTVVLFSDQSAIRASIVAHRVDSGVVHGLAMDAPAVRFERTENDASTSDQVGRQMQLVYARSPFFASVRGPVGLFVGSAGASHGANFSDARDQIWLEFSMCNADALAFGGDADLQQQRSAASHWADSAAAARGGAEAATARGGAEAAVAALAAHDCIAPPASDHAVTRTSLMNECMRALSAEVAAAADRTKFLHKLPLSDMTHILKRLYKHMMNPFAVRPITRDEFAEGGVSVDRNVVSLECYRACLRSARAASMFSNRTLEGVSHFPKTSFDVMDAHFALAFFDRSVLAAMTFELQKTSSVTDRYEATLKYMNQCVTLARLTHRGLPFDVAEWSQLRSELLEVAVYFGTVVSHWHAHAQQPVDAQPGAQQSQTSQSQPPSTSQSQAQSQATSQSQAQSQPKRTRKRSASASSAASCRQLRPPRMLFEDAALACVQFVRVVDTLFAVANDVTGGTDFVAHIYPQALLQGELERFFGTSRGGQGGVSATCYNINRAMTVANKQMGVDRSEKHDALNRARKRANAAGEALKRASLTK
jgi:hypothetical protein